MKGVELGAKPFLTVVLPLWQRNKACTQFRFWSLPFCSRQVL